MNLTLDELVQNSEKICCKLLSADYQLPKPSADMMRRREVLKSSNLDKQYAAHEYKLRCWQAEQIGFVPVTIREMYKMLTGYECDEIAWHQVGWHKYEYYYSYIKDEIITTQMQISVHRYGQTVKEPCKQNFLMKKFFHRYKDVMKNPCDFGCLDYLKPEIPYGVLLRVEEIKKLKLFNCFNAMAPQEAWDRPQPVDPIIVAAIESSNDTKYYFVALWK